MYKVSGKLCDPGNSYIDMGNFVPCGEIHHPGLRQSEDRLELPDRSRRVGTVEPVRGYPWDGRIYGGDGIKLFLKLPDLLTGGANDEILSRPGRRDPGDLLRSVDVDAGTVEMAQDLDGAVASFAQGAGSPLGHPVRTRNLSSVAVLG